LIALLNPVLFLHIYFAEGTLHPKKKKKTHTTTQETDLPAHLAMAGFPLAMKMARFPPFVE
jgi:hypothetical protein